MCDRHGRSESNIGGTVACADCVEEIVASLEEAESDLLIGTLRCELPQDQSSSLIRWSELRSSETLREPNHELLRLVAAVALYYWVTPQQLVALAYDGESIDFLLPESIRGNLDALYANYIMGIVKPQMAA